MIILILIIISAIANAIMDIITHNYAWSIFDKYYYKFNPQYWNPKYSRLNKYVERNRDLGRKKILGVRVHPAFTDAWHLFKSTMIVCLISAIVLAMNPNNHIIKICIFDYQILNMLLYIGILGTIWNLTFSLFYDKLLRQ